jgi:4-amino-4-deoxy-L-arabinose transferase-like glycosyltransferase
MERPVLDRLKPTDFSDAPRVKYKIDIPIDTDAARRSVLGTVAESSRSLVFARPIAPFALFITLGAGAALRFWNINALGYNSDEAVYTGQAASLAGDPELSRFFPIFRAHPMIFQYLLSLLFSIFGVHDIIGRSLAAVVGLATVVLVYRIGADLYGAWVGVLAAAMLALMPYHVVVTRQVLLDGPVTFCTTLTLLMVVRFAITERPIYLMAAGSALGLTFLTKETGFVFAAATFTFLALTPQVRVTLGMLVAAGACTVVPIVMFPLSITLAGRSDTAKSYLVWQLLRPSNHEWSFFLKVVPPAIGWGVLIAALVGFITLRFERTWRETLLLSWIVVPLIVFQVWPVKGFQYLLPLAPAIAVLAARTLVRWRPSRPWLPAGALNVAAALMICLLLARDSYALAANRHATSRMAGAGGIPGVRETGAWIDANVPENAVLVAVGPSMANLIQFYGHRKAYGLSVSTNPLNRNPSYEPLLNPDAQLRYGNVQYLVFDTFSAARSPFFTASLMKYIEKYDAREVFSYALPAENAPPGSLPTKIIIVYEVSPR